MCDDQVSEVGVGVGVCAGGGLSMGRDSMNPMGQSVHNPVSGARAPFTTSQWAELEHQALIFKYMMAGVNVPNELLNPIRKSVASMNGIVSHHAANRKFPNLTMQAN
jgi:hypothetical protein